MILSVRVWFVLKVCFSGIRVIKVSKNLKGNIFLGVKRIVEIPANKDLNEYVNGIFLLQQLSSSTIATLINKPSQVLSGEMVMFVFTVGVYGVQILFHSSANKTYIRYGHSGAFSDWVLI